MKTNIKLPLKIYYKNIVKIVMYVTLLFKREKKKKKTVSLDY